MTSVMRVVESLRLYMLIWSLPYSLKWADALGDAALPAIAAHALLILFSLANFDAAVLEEGQHPRLALVRDRMRFSVPMVGTFRVVCAGTLLVLIVALLVAEPWLGALAGATFGLIALLGGGVTGPARAWRLRHAEAIWPLAALIMPAALVRLHADDAAGAGGSGSSALASGVLGGVTLGVYVLLCVIRDEQADRGLGLRTTATSLGRGRSLALLFVWLCAGVMLGAWGTGAGMWSWRVGGVLSVGAMGTLWLVSARIDGYAVGLWWATSAGAAFLL